MRQVIKYGVMSLTGLVVMLFLSAQAVRADIEVLESSVPELKAGASLKDDARLKLPKGTSIRVFVTTPNGNSTKTLKGPYEGTVADYKEERSWYERLMGSAPSDSDAPMGTTRGIKPQQK
jgi:hypothetical protein